MSQRSKSYAAVVFTDQIDRRELTRAQQSGLLMRLAPGVYTSETDRAPDDVACRHLWRIVAHEIPGAVIVDRSVRDGGLGREGYLYVVGRRKRPLALPGVTVVPRRGPGQLPGDMELPDGISMSSESRALLDNLTPTRTDATGRSRTLSRGEVETWIDGLCAQRGEDGLNRLRDQAKQLAPLLGREKELAVLERLVGAALNTRDSSGLSSDALRRRAAGQPADQRRLVRLEQFTRSLTNLAPDVLPALPTDEGRRRFLPFYEAYFSNFIEGTEFTLDEAAEIVFENRVPAQRPEDAHDIVGTYRLTSDTAEMSRTPASGDELLELLRFRHSVVMAGRPEHGPGEWKTRTNRAGSTEFVEPELVVGTLLQGFEVGRQLLSPFGRATYMMFLVSEVHPFADGNGRVARLMMNAELVRAGEVRILIPTVYRLNYLSALKAASHTGNDSALLATLAFARRWTARIDFSSRQSAEADLERTNALRDAREAEDAGIRLVLP